MTDKWWDISDDELDNAFRDAAEGINPPFDDAAWQNMQHKLDSTSNNRKPLGYKLWWLSGGLLLLLFGGITYFLVEKSGVKESIVEKSGSRESGIMGAFSSTLLKRCKLTTYEKWLGIASKKCGTSFSSCVHTPVSWQKSG